jgi:hypothetical protein
MRPLLIIPPGRGKDIARSTIMKFFLLILQQPKRILSCASYRLLYSSSNQVPGRAQAQPRPGGPGPNPDPRPQRGALQQQQPSSRAGPGPTPTPILSGARSASQSIVLDLLDLLRLHLTAPTAYRSGGRRNSSSRPRHQRRPPKACPQRACCASQSIVLDLLRLHLTAPMLYRTRYGAAQYVVS